MLRRHFVEAFMKRKSISAVLITLAMVIGGAAQAAVIHFNVDLSGLNENPPNASPASGSATIDLDLVTRMLTIDVTFSGLLGQTTAAHIHCCQVPPANAQVATQVPTFIGFPLGVTSGNYQNTFDMTLASSYNPMFISNHGGTVESAFADLLAGMLSGQSYLNIHTSMFGGGEIRGQLFQVPEPAALALVGLMLAGLGALQRGRRT
jgi:hypothetical protein